MTGTHGVAVITGASRGIGAHLARAFDHAGYRLELLSRHGSADTASGPASVSAVDVTDADAVRMFVSGVLDRHGRIDVLVNSAGLIDEEVDLAASDPDQWWRVQEVNVLGPYLMTRFVLPAMLQAGTGRVVNLNSGAGTRAGEVASAYNVSKTALARITGSTHLVGRAQGVYAFDLAPGVVRTDMTSSMRSHEGRTEWTDPHDVCELALALASGQLDAWSGRMVRAGADTVDLLQTIASRGLNSDARRIVLEPYGEDDPLAP